MKYTLRIFLLYLLFLSTSAHAIENRDSVWTDSATLGRVHLIQLSDNDTLRCLPTNALKPILESLGINFGVWGWDHFVMDREWADINARTIRTNIKSNWVLDRDSYSGNQFSHPFHGSMFYGSARYHGHSYYTAALYPLVGSMVWEYFCETNRPAYNDFLSTGIGGSALGEALYRTSDLVFDDTRRGAPRVLREIIGSILCPARGIHRLFSGESWRVSDSRGKMEASQPFQFTIGVGKRFMTEFRHRGASKQVTYLDFALDYGQRFHYTHASKPFDYFRLRLMANITSGNPTISDADIRGRILGYSIDTKGGWQFDFGLYQNFRYVDNYAKGAEHAAEGGCSAGDLPLFAEAASFGFGTYAEKKNRHTAFSNDFSLNGVGFGAVANENFPRRRYNFASGFSLRNEVVLSCYKLGRLGCDAYFGRLYTFKGGYGENQSSDYYWGTRGHCSIFLLHSFIEIPLWHYTQLSLQHKLWYRRSQYDYYPDIHAKSSEILLALRYSI